MGNEQSTQKGTDCFRSGEKNQPLSKGCSGLKLKKQASKESNCFQETQLHPNTKLKNIQMIAKIFSTQESKIHHVWHPIKNCQACKKQENVTHNKGKKHKQKRTQKSHRSQNYQMRTVNQLFQLQSLSPTRQRKA